MCKSTKGIFMQEEKTTEPYASLEELSKVYQELLETDLVNEEEYSDLIQNLQTTETLIFQIFDIFYSFTFNPENDAMQNINNEACANVIGAFRELFIKAAIDKNEIPEFPTITEIVQWVEDAYNQINGQIFEKDFNENVLIPALSSISESILEFAQEELQSKLTDLEKDS
jgi:hypothetical protein